MTCRCATAAEHQARYLQQQRSAAEAREQALRNRTPDPDKFEILEIHRDGNYVALRVKYISCPKCTYEGIKVMVFPYVSELDILKWKRVDPHFRDPSAKPYREAPSPIARFPGSDAGWKDAIEFIKLRNRR